MLHLTVGLKPKNSTPIIQDHSNYLRSLCCNCIGKEPNSPCQFLLSNGSPNLVIENNDKLVSFSLLQSDHYDVKENTITFKDKVFWNVDCCSYDKIEKLVQQLYRSGSICIDNAEFEVFSIDLV